VWGFYCLKTQAVLYFYFIVDTLPSNERNETKRKEKTMIDSILVNGIPLVADHENQIFIDASNQHVVLMDDNGLPTSTTPILLSEPLDYEVKP
jgi:hypothetical protein